MEKEEFIKMLDDTLKEFYECDGGSSSFIFDDKIFRTDTGYAIEGIEFFVARIKEKLDNN